jgi:hypothetical protein
MSEFKKNPAAVLRQAKNRPRLDNPHLPGAELTRDLLGCHKIKLLKHGVRLV